MDQREQLQQHIAQPYGRQERKINRANETGSEGEQTSQAQSLMTNEGISKDNRPNSPLVEHLQRQVANAYLLYTNYKHYHWNTYGPLFRDLHLLFDEFAEAVLGTTDKLAERIRMIGQDPIYDPAEIVQLASIKVAARRGTMRDMIQEADINAQVVIGELRAGVRTADRHEDPGTANLLTNIVQLHEKHEWWLRDMLEHRDGLTT
jgi:starvation-inducible DNA-binding protein